MLTESTLSKALLVCFMGAGVLSAAGNAKNIALDLGDGIEMTCVLIPAGEFLMGSPDGESGRDDDEGPRRTVTLSRPFYMSATEVTQKQYAQVMGANPSRFKGAARPVDTVSHHDAAAFCLRLSEKTGKRVSLPTEAQWEYACRAGSTTSYAFAGDPRKLGLYAWYEGNGQKQTHPVAAKRPNAWGLYDMNGNVYEWCQDWYAKDYQGLSTVDPEGPRSGASRVCRGGGFGNRARYCRSANRSNPPPGQRINFIGFRIVLHVAPACPGQDGSTQGSQ